MAIVRPDAATISRLFRAERTFLTPLLQLTNPVALPDEQHSDVSDDEDGDVYISENKPSREEARKFQRAKSFQELQDRLKKLQGTKDFSLKNKLMKRSLARRIKKKNRKDERRTKNKIAKGEKKTRVESDVKPVKVENNTSTKTAPKPVFNSQGKMVFSKFDFSESGMPEEKKKGERNPKKLLETLKKQKETLKDLNQAGEKEKASHLMEKTAWKNALAKAEGQKIKDDPILLKKSVKKLEQKKKVSAKKWDQRLQGVEKAISDKQKRRDTNLSKRKNDKRKKVFNKAVKKGRMIQ
ncbi:surfeit locus protein 6 homolog isoform X2 [Arctopsyche grandis]|uniref:surfeit locus protein 6 homolog isoform X2 n=1 Tax=Arctopsyche grandis TaxID=121162 RepID=UPI00406D67DA